MLHYEEGYTSVTTKHNLMEHEEEKDDDDNLCGSVPTLSVSAIFIASHESVDFILRHQSN